MLHTKQEIRDEIKRTAKDNAGVPLGVSRFEKEMSWARFGDAQKEAAKK